MNDNDHVGWAYWLEDHWHLCAEEPTAHKRREPVYLERALLEEISNRDRNEEWADKLAYAIAPIDAIGEHSSDNDPWANALDIAETRRILGSKPKFFYKIEQPGRPHVRVPIPPPVMRLLDASHEPIEINLSEAQLLDIIKQATETLRAMSLCRATAEREAREREAQKTSTAA